MKYLISDLGGTLIEEKRGWQFFHDKINLNLKWSDVLEGKIYFEEFYRKEVQSARKKGINYKNIQKIFQNITPKEYSKELLEEAKKKRYKTIILSEELEPCIKEFLRKIRFYPDSIICNYPIFDERGLYNGCIFPYQEGNYASKSKFLEYLAENVGFEKAILLEDFDREAIRRAKEFGILTIGVNCDKADFNIKSLKEVSKHL